MECAAASCPESFSTCVLINAWRADDSDGEMEAAAGRLLEDMLRTSPIGLRLTKECLNASIDAASLEHVVAMEDRNQILCAQTADFREGISAFLQKRSPQYSES